MRLYRPKSQIPSPIIVDLHGGAWNTGDLSDCQTRDEVFVKSGFAVAALNFRHGTNGYPKSLQDINFAIRWLKKNARELSLDPKRVALSGQSSGGHLAALTAMRPNDVRYAEIKINSKIVLDATVACAALQWPVINPLSRYHHALRSLSDPKTASWVGSIPDFHKIFWQNENAMAEGNPMLALERGEKVETPPMCWLQGEPDIVHDYHDPKSDGNINEPERFARYYRNAGGKFEIIRVKQSVRSQPESFESLVTFYKKYLT